MMKAGTETGSLVNHVMSRIKNQPQPGMGATILCWTDRYPATIVRVTPTQVHVREDKATRIDHNGMSESQDWAFSPDEEAPVRVFRLTKRGYRDRCGSGLFIGDRERYYDFSF